MYTFRLIICIATVFGELYVFDPWRVHFYYSSHDMKEIILLYIVIAIITGVIGAIHVPLFVHKILPRTRTRNVLNIGIITFVVLAFIAILCGPYAAIEIFNNRMLIRFFMEWEFAKYIIQIALPFSFVSALLEFYFGKKYAVVIPIKPYSQNDDKILKL